MHPARCYAKRYRLIYVRIWENFKGGYMSNRLFHLLLLWYITKPSNCVSLSVCSYPFQDSKISSMERGLRDLEEEIQMLKSNGALSTEEREEEMKQMEVYRSHSKFMKNKVLRKQ